MTARPWWARDLDDHRQVGGRCPRCRTRRRCWVWAQAFAARAVAEMAGQP